MTKQEAVTREVLRLVTGADTPTVRDLALCDDGLALLELLVRAAKEERNVLLKERALKARQDLAKLQTLADYLPPEVREDVVKKMGYTTLAELEKLAAIAASKRTLPNRSGDTVKVFHCENPPAGMLPHFRAEAEAERTASARLLRLIPHARARYAEEIKLRTRTELKWETVVQDKKTLSFSFIWEGKRYEYKRMA